MSSGSLKASPSIGAEPHTKSGFYFLVSKMSEKYGITNKLNVASYLI
jgi:hypothetical protein